MINNYLIEKNLGEGSFAQVKLCRDKNTGVQYAIKLMNKKELKRKKNPNGTTGKLKINFFFSFKFLNFFKYFLTN